MANASPDRPRRVEVIDSLRGVAALAVVLYHYVGFLPGTGAPVGPVGSAVVALTRYGHLGVPIFFVLSGYVIAMTAARYVFSPATGFRFILRRLVRVAPPYWAMVALIAVALVAGRGAGFFRNTVVTPGQVAAHFAYAQMVLNFPPLDVAYWTLCLEVQFYVVFAASLIALHRRGPALRVGWFFALTVGSALVDFFDAVPQAWWPRLWYQFGTGVLTYYAGQGRPGRWALAALLPVLIGVGVFRRQADNLAAVAAVALLLFQQRPFLVAVARLGVLAGLGRISYSLYLVHGFLGLGLSVWFRSRANRSEMASWLAVAAGTAGAVAFASAFYYACERRAVQWSRAVRVGPPPGPGATP